MFVCSSIRLTHCRSDYCLRYSFRVNYSVVLLSCFVSDQKIIYVVNRNNYSPNDNCIYCFSLAGDEEMNWENKVHEVRFLHSQKFSEINVYKNKVLFIMLLNLSCC